MGPRPTGLVSSEEEEMGTTAMWGPGEGMAIRVPRRGLGRNRPPAPGSGTPASRLVAVARVMPPWLTNKVARNTPGGSGRKEGAGQSLGKTTNSPEMDKIQPELKAHLDKG